MLREVVDNNAGLMVTLMLNWKITMLLRLRLQNLLRLLEMGLLLPLHRWCTIPSNLLMKAIAERGRYESSAAYFPLGLVMNIRSHLDIHVEVVGAG